MTRFLALSFAVVAFAFSACEKHPLPGQEVVTHTHGSGGAHDAGHGDVHAPVEAHAKKDATHAPAAEHGSKAEEKPTFFPEKK